MCILKKPRAFKYAHASTRMIGCANLRFNLWDLAMTFFLNILTLAAVSTAHAAHDPNTCVRFLSPDLSATVQLENQIKDKISERTAKANSAVPVLIRDDGGEPTLLTTGIKKLFTRDIMQFDVDSARNRIAQLAQAWTNSHRKLMTKNIDSKQRGATIEEMRVAIIKIKDRYNKEISEQSRALSEKIHDEYSSGHRSEPNFQEMRNNLLSIYEQMIAELIKRYPLTPAERTKDLQVLLEQPYFFQEAVVKNAQGHYQFEIRQSQAVGVYEPSIGTLVLRLNDKAEQSLLPEQAFVAEFFHGCGTNRSNVASWVALFPMLAQNGTQPFAYNMPGSVGECGIGMNSLRSSQEVGLYINNLAENARETVSNFRLPNGGKANLPNIVVGRSAGSTQGLMAALMNYMAQNHTSIPGADLYFLTSFSDPRTMAMQDENLKEQISRGDIKGIVHDALTHFDDAANGFQHHLEKLKSTQPEILAQFGDDVVFVQGEADQDGQFHDGSGRTAFSNLRDYRDQFAPYGHIYEIEDPLKKYRGKGIIDHFSYDSLEATHFLYSNRPNVTENTRDGFPLEIPEADLPKLRDQSYEVFALKFGMMDYLIDFSPKISAAKKSELQHKRYLLTGSSKPFSYLNWYIKEKLDHKVPQFDDLTLEKIVNDDSIHPSRRSGVPGRVKKVYNYILNEAERVKQLDKQNQPAA
ncbi:MAG: hypothetical protein KDD38_02780 [Bdellovibrionales bacterium]|nr:hypothetical protein [Bdellovibrionales bacterium]